MTDTKIVIEHLDEAELAEHEKNKTFNQQIYDALKGVEIGKGFAVLLPPDKAGKDERKKAIHGFSVFIDGKDVRGIMTAHKSESNKVILKRTA